MPATQNIKSSPVLLFASLPNRTELMAVMVYVNHPPLSSQYAKTAYQWLVLKCRMLIFAESQILCSPVFRSESQLYIVSSKTFVSDGKLKELLDRHDFKETGCRSVEVTDQVLQSCLHYSLLARVAPNWNKVGPYLVQGRDFLMETKSMPALKLDVLVQGDQVCLNILPQCVRLPHLQLSDLGLSPDVAFKFLSQQMLVVPGAAVSSEWLYMLPGLRRARVVSVSHQIPPTCPFLNYKELRRHWKNMYGYRLPEPNPNSSCSPAGPYITISFKKFDRMDVGYTYPALCTRAFGPMVLANVDEASVVRDFAVDLSVRLTHLCGIKFELSLKLGRPLTSLTPSGSEQFEMTSPQQLPSNISAVSLNSLSRGWKSLSVNNASSRQHQVPQTQAILSSKEWKKTSQSFSQPIKTQSESNQTSFVARNGSTRLERSGKASVADEEHVVALSTPGCNSHRVGPEMAADALKAADEPMQGAAQARVSKWAPKPMLQSVQSKAESSSEPPRPVYVPVFTKKIKKGDQKKQSDKVAAKPAVTQVSKNFKNPQMFSSMCSAAASSSNTSTVPHCPMMPAPELPQHTFTMSFTAQAYATPKNNAKYSHAMLGKSKVAHDSDPPPKKVRSSKAEMSNEEIEALARIGKLDSVSAPMLIRWLRDHNIPCKSRDKKIVLMTKVAEYLHLK